MKPPRPSRRPRRTGLWLKAAVAAGLAYAIFRIIPWGEVGDSARQLAWPYIPALLALAGAMILVSCLKWRLFLRARSLDAPLRRLVRLYVTGYFFNTFLPGSMGGDVARSVALGRSLGNPADAFGSVFLERFTGFLAMIGLGVGAAALRPSLVRTPALFLFLGVMALGFFAMAALLLSASLQGRLLRGVDRFPDAGLPRKARRFLAVVFHFRRRPGILGRAMLWSLLFHGLTVLNTWLACRAIGVSVRLLDLAVVVPMILLVSSVPVSLNAIGVMEGAFVFFLARTGVPAAQAMTVALILRAKNLALALLGGLLFLAPSGGEAEGAGRPVDIPGPAWQSRPQDGSARPSGGGNTRKGTE